MPSAVNAARVFMAAMTVTPLHGARTSPATQPTDRAELFATHAPLAPLAIDQCALPLGTHSSRRAVRRRIGRRNFRSYGCQTLAAAPPRRGNIYQDRNPVQLNPLAPSRHQDRECCKKPEG